jgi:hypothetical protein
MTAADSSRVETSGSGGLSDDDRRRRQRALLERPSHAAPGGQTAEDLAESIDALDILPSTGTLSEAGSVVMPESLDERQAR